MPKDQYLKIIIPTGFILAGAYNIVGILIASQGFTNPMLASVDPNVFSWLGQVTVILWGFAYWSVTQSYLHVPYLIGVFALEKLVYAVTWVHWLINHGQTLPAASQSPQHSTLGMASVISYSAYSLSGLSVTPSKNRPIPPLTLSIKGRILLVSPKYELQTDASHRLQD